ncbi:MAG: ribulose-phosphate 3-epimerase [Bacteroidia bacterium]|nr:ribulose-phosphate 3-epimerase [Bacteroidia bacterium]
MKHIVAPSILSCDFAQFGDTIQLLNSSKAEWVHIDVMDGRFVPPISFGLPILKALKKHSKLFLDVHLMVEKPERQIPQFADAGADLISVHLEASDHIHRCIQMIHDHNCKAGIVLNPHSPVDQLSEIATDLDLVLIMSVNPGYGGQKFIEHSLEKIKTLYQKRLDWGASFLIEVDGGVKSHNAKQILRAGADVLVAGSAVFDADDPSKVIEELKSIKINNITV